MALLKYFALAAVVLSTHVNAVAPWNHGDPLKIFVSLTGGTASCPERAPTDPRSAYTQLFYDGKNVVFDSIDVVDKEASTFLITNGWHSVSRDGTAFGPNSVTRIQMAFNGTAAAGCLFVNQDSGSLILKQCSFDDESQAFWVEQSNEQDAFSPAYITAGKGNRKLARPDYGSETAAAVLKDTPGPICMYYADNDWLISAGKTYIPTHALTRLWGKVVPTSDFPVNYTSLSPCVNPDLTDNYNSQDCIIAISFNRAPPDCNTNPQATDCILNYLGAFCGDFVLGRERAGNPIPTDQVERELEGCVRKIALGPCIANPVGAACMSGLFAGFDFPGLGGAVVDPPSGDGDNTTVKYSIFPKAPIKDRVFEQFVVGIGRSLLGSLPDTVNNMFNRNVKNSAVWCHGFAGILNSSMLEIQCSKIWFMHDGAPPQLGYDDSIQEAGYIAGLVGSSLLPINDPLTAAKNMNPNAWPLFKSYFKEPEAAEVTINGQTAKGFIVRGSGTTTGTGTVDISKLAADGNAVPFQTVDETNDALDAALSNGFADCIEVNAPGTTVRRKRATQRPLGLKLACFPSNSGGTPIGPSGVVKIQGDAIQAQNLTADMATTLADLHKTYLSYANDGVELQPTWSDEVKPYADRLKGTLVRNLDRAAVAREFAAAYGVTEEEASALRAWARDYSITPATLQSVLAKIPAYTGVVMRKMNLNDLQLALLTKTQGNDPTNPGLIDLQDVFKNWKSLTSSGDVNAEMNFIMWTTPGLTKYQGDIGVASKSEYTYVIRSTKGKYITPISQGDSEVAFLNDGAPPSGGRLRLLGWGNNSNGNPRVFYFDNVD